VVAVSPHVISIVRHFRVNINDAFYVIIWLMNLLERITIKPDICHGKPTVRGLRYPVEMILELLSSGMTPEEILADYEDLEREDILAVLA
jgi:uncharacterized protein (DUF433 family)